MAANTHRPLQVDRTFYVETQLSDDEIAEREVVRQAWAAVDERKKREHHRRMHEFRWHGGML
jgi:hypothetical protein